MFYRPSFGRSGGLDRSEFGEFDSIVTTATGLYLVESKWDSAGKARRPFVPIDQVQSLRHAVFRWMLNRWRAQRPDGYRSFRLTNDANYRSAFGGKPMPPEESLLASNLVSVLRSTCNAPAVHDVLLYFHRAGTIPPTGAAAVEPIAGQAAPNFLLVPMEYTSLPDCGYITLASDLSLR